MKTTAGALETRPLVHLPWKKSVISIVLEFFELFCFLNQVVRTTGLILSVILLFQVKNAVPVYPTNLYPAPLLQIATTVSLSWFCLQTSQYFS